MLQEVHCALSPILSESQLTSTLGGGFENHRIMLPDTTCELSGSEAIKHIIGTSADLNLGGGFEMVLDGVVLLLVQE